MKSLKSSSIQVLRRKDLALFFVIIISGISLFGWYFGRYGLTSSPSIFTPVSPLAAIFLIALSLLSLIRINFEKSRFTKIISTPIILLISLWSILIFLDYVFIFNWNTENILVKNLVREGEVPDGLMSPITSLVIISICISILGVRQNKFKIANYVGGSLALLACFASSIIVIGYLYKSPLLYGGEPLNVALQTAICLLLFSIVFLRIYEFRFWTFNLLRDNKIAIRILKSLLPIVIGIIILQGYFIIHFSLTQNNPTTRIALILLIVIVITVIVVSRVSLAIGYSLLRAEKALMES